MPFDLNQFRSIKWTGNTPPMAIPVGPNEGKPAVIPIAQVWKPAPEATPVAEEPEIAALSEEHRQFFMDYLKDNGGWLNLVSSNVAAVAYHYGGPTGDRIMDVEYDARRPGEKPRRYSYYEVPVDFFCKFVDAESHGRFVWDEIRRPDAFDFTKYGF